VPGLQCVDALTEGTTLIGSWRDRSLEYEAKRRGKEEVDSKAFMEGYTLRLDPLPCWQHLSEEKVQGRICTMIDAIDTETVRRVVLNGKMPLGPAAIRSQHPDSRQRRGGRRSLANLQLVVLRESPGGGMPTVSAGWAPPAGKTIPQTYEEAAPDLSAPDW
jgi:hypothetical protein